MNYEKYIKTVLLLSLVIICSCDDDSCDDDSCITEDNILYITINKTITAGQTDTIIYDKCYSLVCTIDTTALTNKQIKIFTSINYDCIGGGGIGISANDNKTFSKFSTGDIIGDDSNWTTELFLDNYNFYDDLYIGLKYSYPDGEKTLFYGWLRIELSEDKRTLHIKDKAKNLTEGNSILAGQVE